MFSLGKDTLFTEIFSVIFLFMYQNIGNKKQ